MKIDFNKYSKVPAVYIIQNKINGKRYAGSTNDLYRRIGLHKSSIINQKGNNRLLLEDFNNNPDIDNYEVRFKTFSSDKSVDFIRSFEERYIRMFKPELNISKYPTSSNGKPNLGKKFSSEWKSKLPKCKNHSKETLEKLTKINKEGGCKLIFTKDDSTLNFASWVEASKYFNTKRCTLNNAFIKNGKWKGWSITKISNQKKRVKILKDNETFIFNSSAEGDRFLNLWRGCISNAIKNGNGWIDNIFVEYIE